METSTTPAPEAKPSAYPSHPLELAKLSWEAFKIVWLRLLAMLCIVLALGVVGFAVVIGGVVALRPELGTIVLLGLLGVLLLVVIGSYFNWIITRLLLAAARGQKLGLREAMPKQGKDVVRLILTSLLLGLIVVLGFILFIIPGLIFAVWYIFVGTVVVDEGLGGWAALKRSKELVRGRFWEVAAAILLPMALYIVTVVPVLGPVVYFIASLVLIPLIYVRYTTLKELKAKDDWQTVPVHPLNYLVIVLGLIGMGLNTSNEVNDAMKDVNDIEKNPSLY